MEKTMHLDKKTENTLIESLPNNKVASTLAYFYSIFSDSTRIKILVALISSEMCVKDLSTLLNINQTTISHQLKTLRSIGVVRCTRKNKFLFYRVSNKLISTIMLKGVDYISTRHIA